MWSHFADLPRREVTPEDLSLHFKIATFFEATQNAVLLFGLAFLILVAVLLTGSRGGIVATILGLAVLSVITGVNSVQGSRNLFAIIAFGALLIGASFLLSSAIRSAA